MLSSLHIHNYVLIDSLDIDFPEGLIIITGETGAGKTILLGALSLVMGAKADASAISDGADSCVVEAEFDVKDDPVLKDIMDQNEIDWNGGHLIIRRVVNLSGRSRSFVNDLPVALPVLPLLSSRLIDIHSQHQTLMLSDKQFRLSVLDHFAGSSALLSECFQLYGRLSALKKKRDDVAERLKALSAQKDYNEAQFKQLESAKLKDDAEREDLEVRQKQLANSEEIKENLCQVEELLSPAEAEDDDSVRSLSASLQSCVRLLEKTSKFIPEAADLSSRMETARLELDDIMSSVSEINSKIDVSQDALKEVEDRMSLLYDLMKKFACASIAELKQVREKFSLALFDSSSLVDEESALDKEIAEVSGKLTDTAKRLHDSRHKASASFASAIEKSIRFLELDRAVFQVRLNPQEMSASGVDEVEFLFSSTGQNPVDVAKCASGGELSRIMLCLKAMMAKYASMPTMIFDEIDTGVSGSVADKMGSMICAMGKDMQVFAITHLPQVAAKGMAHYQVTKSFDGSKAVSSIKRLSEEERISEIARMLSGSVVTREAIANAKSLLSD